MNEVLSFFPSFDGEKLSHENKDKLSWFIFLRLGVITSLLAFFIFFKLKATTTHLTTEISRNLIAVYFLLTITYLVSFFYAIYLNRVKNVVAYISSQIGYDIIFVTALIYLLNTPESIFNILYSVTIILASLVFQRSGALLTACFCTICFSLYLIYNPIIDSQRHLYVLFINNFTFFLVAIASGTMADQLKNIGIKLKEKESFTDAILDNMSSGLLTINAQSEITYYNAAAQEITGKSYQEVYNYKLSQIFPEFAEFLRKKVDPKTRPEIKYMREGSILSLGIVSSPLKDHENATKGQIIIFQDLTKLKKMEEEMRVSDKLAAVGKLAAGIAHEIRNPLASMSGSIEMLKTNIHMSQEDKKLMDIALKETERLNTLITEFLTFVKPSVLRKEKIKIKEYIENMIATFKINPQFKKNISITTKGKDIEFYFDPERGKQILWNLLINASQAMREGGTIEISWNEDQNKNILCIKDHGCGIPENIREKIFDPFFTTKEGGTGLGLATVYKIIEAHGGRIDVTSKVNQGTTFNIEFPNKE
ncbi:MAG: PAS domain S-box protein [Deltaproteobacteria bacterium]|nr:PAS domain S-box protein [Deltaproteobacteria bacterium]